MPATGIETGTLPRLLLTPLLNLTKTESTNRLYVRCRILTVSLRIICIHVWSPWIFKFEEHWMPRWCNDDVIIIPTADSDWMQQPHCSRRIIQLMSFSTPAAKINVQHWKWTLVRMHSDYEEITQRRMQTSSSPMTQSHSPRNKCNTLYYTKTDCISMENGLNVSFNTVRPHNNIEILHCQIYNVLPKCLSDFTLMSLWD